MSPTLRRIRNDGYGPEHANVVDMAAAEGKRERKYARVGGVAAPKLPHRPIEGAHLRPTRFAQEIAEADRQWEDAYPDGDAA